MSSSRLPGKVLMMAKNKPFLQHLVERVKLVKGAHQVVVATSDTEGDDVIAQFCEDQKIECFRGSLHDVLDRYKSAADAYFADAIVRLTGDCPLIDPTIVEKVIQTYLPISNNKFAYASNTLFRTFPRGMDVEVFSKALLDFTDANTVDLYDREHVTPFMIRNDLNLIEQSNLTQPANFSAYRFTLDYTKDLGQIRAIIESGLPISNLSDLLLCANKLSLLLTDNHLDAVGLSMAQAQDQDQDQDQDPSNNLLNKFEIGSAQFGMYYGRFNLEGVPSHGVVEEILAHAYSLGIRLVDTAASYGIAEQVLGNSISFQKFDVVTKTPKFVSQSISRNDADYLKVSAYRSLDLLKKNHLNGLLIHHANDLLLPGADYLYEALCLLRQNKVVEKIGTSAYSQDDIEKITERYELDIVQIPMNLLDRRLIESGYLEKLASKGTEIHVRSVFLQGLLLRDPSSLPNFFSNAKGVLTDFHLEARERSLKPAHVALHYLLKIPKITKIIVGIESLRQLKDLFDHFPKDLDFNYSRYKFDDSEVLNPVLWRE
jgi:spore coat polysaccharide biosynthesis protein SpsF (cytidylyltransferase family)/aryl-alcohol dehydrogenase-like predicted oxidoreductase